MSRLEDEHGPDPARERPPDPNPIHHLLPRRPSHDDSDPMRARVPHVDEETIHDLLLLLRPKVEKKEECLPLVGEGGPSLLSHQEGTEEERPPCLVPNQGRVVVFPFCVPCFVFFVLLLSLSVHATEAMVKGVKGGLEGDSVLALEGGEPLRVEEGNGSQFGRGGRRRSPLVPLRAEGCEHAGDEDVHVVCPSFLPSFLPSLVSFV